jgi:hypothetical protein
MGHDDRREIFERLEALERLARSRHDERGSWEHDRRGERDRDRGHHRGLDRDCDRDHGGDDFDEKRIIDTIVHLVSERVAHIVDERQPRGSDGGGEKRLVDLIVGLVSEHVEDIVRTELDRRFGCPDPHHAGEDRPASHAAGGSSEPEPV